MPEIAVLIPEGEDFASVFEVVSSLCEQLGFSPRRISSEKISEEELTFLRHSVAAVIDFTKKDFFSAIVMGICMAQDKLWIGISQNGVELPANLKEGGEIIQYQLGEAGLKELRKNLYKALKSHKDTIRYDVQHLLKRQEISYKPLKEKGENEFGYREYELAEEGFTFIEIPEGPFLYGKARKREELPTFLMSKYLLTNEQWHRFLEDTGYDWKGHWLGRVRGKLKRVPEFPSEMADYPIVDISFYDLWHYTEWLNRKYGTKETYFTVPEEKQWEKAARGTDGRRFPWGNEAPNHELALYEKDLRHGPAPVDSFHKGASPYGCLHMAGNVFEWTSSFFDFDFKSRVVRGGSYAIEPMELECSARFSRRPEIGHWTTGGRIVVLVW